MKFPGVSKNSMWNLQGLIKNEVEFPRVTKKNNKEFPGCKALGFWGGLLAGNSEGDLT